MAESKLVYQPLAKEFAVCGWPHTRIENKIDPGTPDLLVSVRPIHAHAPGKFRPDTGAEVFVEMKHVPTPPLPETQGVNLGLRKEQFIWLRAAHLQGRKCCIVALVGDLWLTMATVRGYEMAKRATPWNKLCNEALFVGSGPGEVCKDLFERFGL